MSGWQPNIGSDPNRGKPEDAPRIERVFVRLRNGSHSPQPWPVDTGRRDHNTRWTLEGHSHDIIEWREA